MTKRASRLATRSFAITFALALPLMAGPAFASEPSTWPSQPTHSFWDYFVLLILIPAGLAITITILVLLPSLVKGDRYDRTKAWSGMKKASGPQG